MVFNSTLVVSVAHISANTCQQLACCFDNHTDQISSQQLLDLLCCFPLHQLGRLAFYFWTFLCLPLPDSYFTYYPTRSSSDDDDEDEYEGGVYYPHSYASSSSSPSIDLDEYYYHPHSD